MIAVVVGELVIVENIYSLIPVNITDIQLIIIHLSFLNINVWINYS